MSVVRFYKFRKGLETPLRIAGMYTKYFYPFCVIVGVLVLYLVGKFLTLAKNFSKESVAGFFLHLAFCAIIILISKGVFSYKSERKGVSFPKTEMNISNRDILNVTK
ncbi:hypothetical protein BHU16_07140 [Tannerella sp. oral taxon 808]|nr:hypothetical protein BHU16_07140 [Tannerella sp. oral taxon 808]